MCIVFSSLMLVLCMLYSAKLSAGNERLAMLEESIAELEKENRLLSVQLEMGLSLQELESYALYELGMQRCSPGQIIYLELNG